VKIEENQLISAQTTALDKKPRPNPNPKTVALDLLKSFTANQTIPAQTVQLIK